MGLCLFCLNPVFLFYFLGFFYIIYLSIYLYLGLGVVWFFVHVLVFLDFILFCCQNVLAGDTLTWASSNILVQLCCLWLQASSITCFTKKKTSQIPWDNKSDPFTKLINHNKMIHLQMKPQHSLEIKKNNCILPLHHGFFPPSNSNVHLLLAIKVTLACC